MAKLTPEQMEALISEGYGGTVGQGPVGWEPLRAGLDAALAYRTPIYRVPSEADRARAADLWKLRNEAAIALADQQNRALEIRLDGNANMANALANMAKAWADNNNANAQVTAEHLRAIQNLSQTNENLAQATRYKSVDTVPLVETSATGMTTAYTGAVKEAKANADPKAREAAGENFVQALADSATPAIVGQSTPGGRAGAYEATSQDAQRAVVAYVAQLGMPKEEQQALANQLYASYQGKLASQGVVPQESDLLRVRDIAEADAKRNRAMLQEAAKRSGLPPELTAGVLQLFETQQAWNDPSNPNAMNQMVMASGDLATEALRQSVAQLDAEIDQATTVRGDPFYESLSKFKEDHPWYDTWRRASGIRNHEEAMRWIVAHAEADTGDLVNRMDQLWLEQTGDDPAAAPDVATMRDLLQGERAARQEMVQQARKKGGEEGDKPTMRGYQVGRLGRAAGEVGDLFRPTTGINPIPTQPEPTSTVRDAAASRSDYYAYTPTMGQAGVPDYKGKRGQGPTSPRGFPSERSWSPDWKPPEPAKAGAGGNGAGGPQPGAGGEKPVGSIERTRLRLLEAGRPYRPGDFLLDESRRLA